jgi:hypothetical protein
MRRVKIPGALFLSANFKIKLRSQSLEVFDIAPEMSGDSPILFALKFRYPSDPFRRRHYEASTCANDLLSV